MIKIGGRYAFKGYKPSDGFAEVRWENLISSIVDPGRECKFLWVLIVRTGHPLDGKEVPYDLEGKFIGCGRRYNFALNVPNIGEEIIDAVV